MVSVIAVVVVTFFVTVVVIVLVGSTVIINLGCSVVDADDVVGELTGTFNLESDGTAVVEVEIATNTDDDDNALESISFFITGTPAYADAFILGANDSLGSDPIWSVTSDVNYVREGETVTFTVGALNIPDGTNFKYRLEGDITRRDIVGYRLESSVDVDANTA